MRKYKLADYDLRLCRLSKEYQAHTNFPARVAYLNDWPLRFFGSYDLEMHVRGQSRAEVLALLAAKFASFVRTPYRLPTPGRFSWDKVKFKFPKEN